MKLKEDLQNQINDFRSKLAGNMMEDIEITELINNIGMKIKWASQNILILIAMFRFLIAKFSFQLFTTCFILFKPIINLLSDTEVGKYIPK